MKHNTGRFSADGGRIMTRKTGLFNILLLFTITGMTGTPAAAFLSPDDFTPPLQTPSVETTALSSAIATYAVEKSFAGITLTQNERDALSSFYAARWNQPYWMNEDGPKPIVSPLLSALRHADLYALAPSDFASALKLEDNGWDETGPIELARSEITLMRAALLYARQASAGRIRPGSIARKITVKPKPRDPAMVLDIMSTHENPVEYLRSLHPDTPEFKQLREAYLDYRNIVARGGWPVISRGKALKLGSTGKRVIALRKRLAATGDLPASEPTEKESFDEALRKAVMAAQTRYGIKPDGVAGSNTLRIFNIPAAKRLEQLRVNLERRRWLPRNLGYRHVIVNQAEFKLRVFENNKEIYQSRVVVGKPGHSTPEFSNSIKTVVFNPYWNVPRSIATKEILPILARNPGYLARKGMSLISSRGRTISPYGVNWDRVSRRSFNFRIRQRPGARNALGRIKFLFPNEHSVYMHDTPSKSLFKRDERAFSHGCVRVQDPVKFAEVLMQPQFGWSKNTIARKIAARRNRAVRLKENIPVHLTYRTVWVDKNGKLNFRRDFYGRDKTLAAAMKRKDRPRKLARLRRTQN